MTAGRFIVPISMLLTLVTAAACGGAPTRTPEPPTGDAADKVPAAELYKAGLDYAKVGDTIRASQYITAALKHGFPAKTGVPALIQIYVKASRLRDAIAVAERHVNDDPADWRLRLVLATMYLSIREVDQATVHTRKVVETKPDDPHGHYLLALIAKDELSDDGLARQEFATYLALSPSGDHAAEAKAYLAQPAPQMISLDAAPVVESDGSTSVGHGAPGSGAATAVPPTAGAGPTSEAP